MEHRYPRLVIAAPKSGSGKTVITCALLAAFQRRGITCRSFKCGPDYIDPMFHRTVLGVEGGNLDTFFLEEEKALSYFTAEAEPDGLSLIEGVMGYYDGMGGDSTWGSTYETARAVNAPVVLVVDAKGSSLSLAALIRGFLEYKEDSRIRGVILNRTTPVMAERLRPAIEELGLRLFGCLPDSPAGALKSRHLGLVTPDGVEDIRSRLFTLAEELEKTVDVGGLLALSQTASPLRASALPPAPEGEALSSRGSGSDACGRIRIGIARDPAFCFYYQENLHLLESLGAELIPFRPTGDTELPDGICGLLIGGGYPELYAKELSENKSMRDCVAEAAREGMPVLAECGGFLYLLEEMQTESGESYPMAGVLTGRSFPTGKLTRFGYVELTAKEDTRFLKKGEQIRGHEFHYWDTDHNGDAVTAAKPGRPVSWDCIHACGNLQAGFPHLYYPSAPQLAERWIQACRDWRRTRKGQDVKHD